MAIEPSLRLQHFAFHEGGVYSLIPLPKEPWVTVRHQQVRAINLALLLARDSTYTPVKVLVIGGGVAGMTFAAAWRCLCPSPERPEVHVLESRDHVMNNLRGCKTRYLHPNLFTWPEEGWDDKRARLPVLDWSANIAHDVFRELWEGVDSEIRISTLTTTESVIVKAAHEVSVRWRRDSEHFEERFDAVVLALGPGPERFARASSSAGYWIDDRLDQSAPEVQGRSREIVIAGLGDGGLTDFLRATINEFVDHAWLATFAEKIHEQATTIRARRLLAREQEETEDPGLYREQASALLEREPRLISLRGGLRVRLLGMRATPYANPTSFPINRLLTAMVLEQARRTNHQHTIEYVSARIHRVLVDSSQSNEPERWVLAREESAGGPDRIVALPADDAIARIGVDWTTRTWDRTPPFAVSSGYHWPHIDHSRRLCLRQPRVLHHNMRVESFNRIKLGVDLDLGDSARDPDSPLLYWSMTQKVVYYCDIDDRWREQPVGSDQVVVIKLRNAEGDGFLDVVLCPRLPRYQALSEVYGPDTHLAYRLWGALASGYQRVVLGVEAAPSQSQLEVWMAASARRRIDWGMCVERAWGVAVSGEPLAALTPELALDPH